MFYGSGDEKIHFKYESADESWSGESKRPLKGIVFHVNRLFRQTKSEYTRRWYASFMNQQPCPTCEGTRLRPEARGVLVGGRTITEVGTLAIDEAHDWVVSLGGKQLTMNGNRLSVNGNHYSVNGAANPQSPPPNPHLLDEEQFEIAEEVLKEIRDRLQFMLNVGLHYLTLDRPAPSLSGGEGQRIRLASQIGCGLVVCSTFWMSHQLACMHATTVL